MNDPSGRRLRAHVDPDLCMGVALCTQAAPRAFRIGADGRSVFLGEGLEPDAALREAADLCPNWAIRLLDDA